MIASTGKSGRFTGFFRETRADRLVRSESKGLEETGMNLAGRLDSSREDALREIDKIDDDVVLSKDLDHLVGQIAERHYLEPPRLHRAVIGTPRAVSMGVPGDPGREHSLAVAPATRVEMWLLVNGFATIARLSEGCALDLGEAEIDGKEHCLVVAFIAEHPVAEEANEYFQETLLDVEQKMGRVRAQVEAFNESLVPALTEALQAAQVRARERRSFAARLTIPQPKEPWDRP